MTRHPFRRLHLAAAVATTVALSGFAHQTGLAFQPSVVAAAARRADPRVMELGYVAAFSGVTHDQLQLWEGAVGGEMNADLALTVKMLGEPADAARQVWAVQADCLIYHDGAGRSFVADLRGTIEWRSGLVRLRGRVAEGALAGAEVSLDGTMKKDYSMAGALRVAPAPQVASR